MPLLWTVMLKPEQPATPDSQQIQNTLLYYCAVLSKKKKKVSLCSFTPLCLKKQFKCCDMIRLHISLAIKMVFQDHTRRTSVPFPLGSCVAQAESRLHFLAQWFNPTNRGGQISYHWKLGLNRKTLIFHDLCFTTVGIQQDTDTENLMIHYPVHIVLWFDTPLAFTTF